MLPVLGSPTVVNIVGVCDSILYKAISGVLMPTVLQALPDRWASLLPSFFIGGSNECHILTLHRLFFFLFPTKCEIYLSSFHSLTQVIRKFAKQLDEWLKIALHDLPENLRNIKFERKHKVHHPPEGFACDRSFMNETFKLQRVTVLHCFCF